MKHDGVAVPFQFHFSHSIHGLSIGAPVEFRGIEVGEVKSIGVELTEPTTISGFPLVSHSILGASWQC